MTPTFPRVRRAAGLLAVVIGLLALPGSALAAHTAYLDAVSPTQPGCQVKGLWGIPANVGGGLPTNVYFYTVTAVTAAGETNPCGAQPVSIANPPNNGALLQWNATPGALAYKVYRAAGNPPVNQGALQATPAVTTFPPSALCVLAQGQRCRFVDGGQYAPDGTAPPATPAAAPQSGGHPDLTITQRVDYGGANNNSPAADPATDDPFPNDPNGQPATLKTDVFHFPAGLLANPLATRDQQGVVTRCPLTGPNSLLGDPNRYGSDDPAEDTCPRASLVGTIQSVSRTPSGYSLTQGDIYNGATKGSEAARLFIALRPVCSAGSPVAPGSATCTAGLGASNREVEKQFLAGVSTIVRRGDGIYAVDVATVEAESDHELAPALNVLAPNPNNNNRYARVGQIPIQVRQIRQSLFGSADQASASTADDVPFVYLPTACGDHVMTADKTTHASSTVSTASRTFTTTECDKLPFAPTLDVSAGGKGLTAKGAHPAFTATIRQANGEAATKSAQVTLPKSLTANIAGLTTQCTEQQLGANQCPAASIIGQARAVSPLAPGPLTGPVVAVEQAGDLPKLVVLLTGPLSVRLDATIQLDASTPGVIRIVNRFGSIPDLPLSEFTLGLKGGTGGILTNASDLCSGGGKVDAVFTGHNAKVATIAPELGVTREDCPKTKITAKATLRRVKSGSPTMTLSISRIGAPAGERITGVRIRLPNGLAGRSAKKTRVTVSRTLSRSAYKLSRGALRITNVGTGGAQTVKATFRKGSLKAGSKLRRKGRKQTLTFKVRVTDASNRVYNLNVRVKPKS
jgi:hypothetical protein